MRVEDPPDLQRQPRLAVGLRHGRKARNALSERASRAHHGLRVQHVDKHMREHQRIFLALVVSDRLDDRDPLPVHRHQMVLAPPRADLPEDHQRALIVHVLRLDDVDPRRALHRQVEP